MNTIHGLDLFLGIVFWCVSFVRICFGFAVTNDYIVILFSTVLIIYDCNKFIKQKQQGKSEEACRTDRIGDSPAS